MKKSEDRHDTKEVYCVLTYQLLNRSCAYENVRVRAYVCVRACARVYVFMYVCTHVCVFTCICASTYVLIMFFNLGPSPERSANIGCFVCVCVCAFYSHILTLVPSDLFSRNFVSKSCH